MAPDTALYDIGMKLAVSPGCQGWHGGFYFMNMDVMRVAESAMSSFIFVTSSFVARLGDFLH